MPSASSRAGRLRFFFSETVHRSGIQLDVRTGLEQRLEQRLRGAVAVARGQLEGEQAVEVVGQHGHGEIEIDLDDHRGGEPVEVEERELLGDGFLDEPALGVAAEQGGEAGLEVIGDQQGGRFDDFEQTGAVADGDADLLALGGRDGLGRLDQVAAAAADGDEADALLVEALEAGVGGEAAIEDEEAELEAAGRGEVEELEDGCGAGLAADGGVGAEQEAGVGILGEGGGEAGEAAAAQQQRSCGRGGLAATRISRWRDGPSRAYCGWLLTRTQRTQTQRG